MSNYSEKFEKMRIAGKLASKTLDMLTDEVKEGVSTNKIDKLGYEFIRDNGGYSAPLYYRGFTKSLCTSLNHVVCHGIPSDRILNEPTAAALAYGFEKSSSNNVLVFDLGGGTFDVSLLKISNGVFDVKATCGDTQLGGNNFDSKIVDWLAERFLKKYKIDLRRDRQALQRLTEARKS